MNKAHFPRFAILLLLLYVIQGAAAGEALAKPKPKSLTAAVWVELGSADGKEVVVEPDLKKLKAQRVTLEQLSTALLRRRFAVGEWTIQIKGKKIDLSHVAKLAVRELQAPPFTVKLRDGREVLITPDPKRIAHYVVTGRYFEEDVRKALAEYSAKDPGDIHVLSMIPVPGNVRGGHFTEAGTMTHFSVGEPLENFAKVEVKSKGITTK